MRVVQTVFGVFHHFDLARELAARGHLERIYTTFPRWRVDREGVSAAQVETFPWFHVAELAASRWGPLGRELADRLGHANALRFDDWTERRVRGLLAAGSQVDALVGISGSSLRTGALVQRHGGVFVCDRGSTHQRYQERVVAEEYARWGVTLAVSDERDTLREEAIYAQADAITVPSTVAARSFAAMGVPAAKVHVIPYGVRLEAFSPAQRLADGPVEGEFNVLFAGAVGLRKGLPYALEAFARLRHPHKQLRVAGAIQPDARALLARLPAEHVTFLGALPQAELAGEMRRSHAFLLPSIEEGLALVQAQAMASGCPVVCSEATGGEDLFTNGVEGFISPVRDVAGLQAGLEALAGDRALWLRMRAAGLARVAAMGGWREYGDRWEMLLQALSARAR